MKQHRSLRYFLIFALILFIAGAIPAAAQEPTAEPTAEAAQEPTVEPTDEPTAEPTVPPTDEATAEPTVPPTDEATAEPTTQPTDEATAEPTTQPTDEATAEPTDEATPEPTVEATVQPTVEATATVTATVTVTPTVEMASDDVDVAGALPGTFSSQILAIANVETSGSAQVAALSLDEIGGAGSSTVNSGNVYPGGVTFIRDSDLPSDGEFAGVVQTGFQAAAAVLTVNSSAKVADAYPGLGTAATATELFGTLIFNKHANFESIFYCQNAGSSNATISAALYKTGESSPKVTLTSGSLAVGEGVKWDIADNGTVQAAWPGGNGELGFVKFTSSQNIACVVDNQRLASPYVQSVFQAVPASGFASTDLRVPLVFNGHGSSSTNVKARKWLTGISFVNTSGSNATVSVTYSSGSYSNTCTGTILAGGSGVWYAPEVGTSSSTFDTCSEGALTWPGPTLGSATISSNVAVLAIANSNRYDTGASLGAGYSSLGAAPSAATTRAVCPLAFNKNAANDWITGIQVANVGGGSTDVTFKMVRAGQDPAASGASVTLSSSGVGAGSSATAYFPEIGSALTSFEGAIFVQSSGAPIVAASSSTNYSTLGAAALYDCINY